MTRNSESSELVGVMAAGDAARRKLSPVQIRLRAGAGILAVLNALALYLYLSPPGGSRQELELEGVQVRSQIRAAQTQSAKSRSLAANMETAGEQASAFSEKYFLPRRTAYVTIFQEIQRMAKASGIQARDAGWSEDPIEGTNDDLTLLNITANYEGTNSDLMRFLYEADHSPMLLVLDMLQASPQQHNNTINTSIRFQAIVREPTAATLAPVAAATGGQKP